MKNHKLAQLFYSYRGSLPWLDMAAQGPGSEDHLGLVLVGCWESPPLVVVVGAVYALPSPVVER